MGLGTTHHYNCTVLLILYNTTHSTQNENNPPQQLKHYMLPLYSLVCCCHRGSKCLLVCMIYTKTEKVGHPIKRACKYYNYRKICISCVIFLNYISILCAQLLVHDILHVCYLFTCSVRHIAITKT